MRTIFKTRSRLQERRASVADETRNVALRKFYCLNSF